MDYLTNYYKNLSEQLQEKINKLNKLLSESAPDPNAEKWDRHKAIADSIVKHMKEFPHETASYEEGLKGTSHASKSASHIYYVLNNHPEAPFMNPNEAIEAIHPHAIQGNYSLEERMYRTADHGGDISERDDYQKLIQKNENSFAEELYDKVVKDVGQMKDAEDYGRD